MFFSFFNFWKFYNGLLIRTNYFDNYWDRFPHGKFRFKKETLSLLKEDLLNKDGDRLFHTMAVIWADGADSDYTEDLLQLLDEKWHISEENIVSVLEQIKDPRSVDKLYEIAIDIPDYDEMRALAKKCIFALAAIQTPEAVDKLRLLGESDDDIIKENALSALESLFRRR